MMPLVMNAMWLVLGAKKTVMEAWDMVNTIQFGVNRVKEANA
jgi:hypothetical protein